MHHFFINFSQSALCEMCFIAHNNLITAAAAECYSAAFPGSPREFLQTWWFRRKKKQKRKKNKKSAAWQRVTRATGHSADGLSNTSFYCKHAANCLHSASLRLDDVTSVAGPSLPLCIMSSCRYNVPHADLSAPSSRCLRWLSLLCKM